MIQMETMLVVADNTGARSAKMIGVLGKRSRTACIGDVITCHIRDSIPTAAVKKGSVVKAVVVPHRLSDPPRRRFDPPLRFQRGGHHRQGQQPARHPDLRTRGP
jgi:large subunit ribosomal protein L14